MGRLDFGGLIRKACLQYVPEATVGEYALIHVGFALATVSPEEAARTFDMLAALGQVETELEPPEPDTATDERGAA